MRIISTMFLLAMRGIQCETRRICPDRFRMKDGVPGATLSVFTTFRTPLLQRPTLNFMWHTHLAELTGTNARTDAMRILLIRRATAGSSVDVVSDLNPYLA